MGRHLLTLSLRYFAESLRTSCASIHIGSKKSANRRTVNLALDTLAIVSRFTPR